MQGLLFFPQNFINSQVTSSSSEAQVRDMGRGCKGYFFRGRFMGYLVILVQHGIFYILVANREATATDEDEF
jgi:hypothetical protein